MKLCVSCKACRRECPTGVDMARMKIEVLAARAAKHGLTLHEPPGRLAAALRADRGALALAVQPARPSFRAPRRCPKASPNFPRAVRCRAGATTGSATPRRRRATLSRLRGRVGEGAAASERARPRATRAVPAPSATSSSSPTPSTAISSRRTCVPRSTFCAPAATASQVATPADGSTRPLCCGRTFLAVGRVDKAREEAERTLAALAPYVARGVPVIGLEPSCLFSLPRRDSGDHQGRPRRRALAAQAMLFEEFLAARGEGRPAQLAARPLPRPRAPARPLPSEILRCHGRGDERAQAGAGARGRDRSSSSCCGMAGAFGYRRRHRRRFARHGRAVPAAGGAQGAGRRRSSSPTAPPAGTRSRTGPGGPRFTSRRCWPDGFPFGVGGCRASRHLARRPAHRQAATLSQVPRRNSACRAKPNRHNAF